MAAKDKFDAKKIKEMAQSLELGKEVWDTELAGFHVRKGKRSLTFRLHYRTKTGRRRVLTIGSYGKLTLSQAYKIAKEKLAVVIQGGDPQADQQEAKAEALRQEQQTLRAYLDGPYTAYQIRNKDGDATLKRIRHAFADWLDLPMGGLTRADVERWQAKQERVEKPKGKGEPPPKPLAFSTIKRNFGALYTLLEHASEREVIPTNPLKGIKLQKPALTEEELAQQGTERRYLEPDEVEKLFIGLEEYQEQRREQRRRSRAHGKPYLPDLDNVAYVDHVKPWILSMYFTGFRHGDLFGLRWEHVNLDFGTIRKTIEKTAHIRPEPQTFPLSSAVVNVLKTWWKQKAQPKTGLVFPSQRNSGKRLDKTAMRKPWTKVRELGGLPVDLDLYSLRHNFASQLVMAGVDLLTVSKLLAHADIQTTIDYYAHLAPDHKRNAVEEFAKMAQGRNMITTSAAAEA